MMITVESTGATPHVLTGKTQDGKNVLIRSKHQPIFANMVAGRVELEIVVDEDG